MAAIQNESKIPVGAILVGKYRVTREIGRGGMAAVYEALHISLNKRIAIKVLAAELSASTVVIERFFREARAAASVKSPYIVDVYDSGRLEDGRPFIAMELLEGESLYDRMARVRIIDVPTTIRVVAHCSRGLMKAHAAGIVHRDLKPENIFLTHGEGGEEVVKLLDFGLAKFYAPVHADEKTARLTREGAVFGTPAYMSPEQVRGQGSVDHRADLWAIGCIAYECLIGRPVWNTDQGVAMTFAAIAAAAIPIPSKQRPDLPPSFDEWFAKALERDVAHRFQNSKELSEAFARAMGAGLLPSSTEGEDALSFVPPDPSQLSPASGRVEWSTPTRPRGSSRGSDAQNSQDAGAFLAAGSGGGFAGAGETPAHSQGAPPYTSPPPAFRSTWTRYVISVVSLAVAGASSYIAWANYLRPQVLAPLVHSTAALPTSSAAATSSELPAPTEGEPKWAETLGDGQRLFSAGDFVGAAKKFKDAQDQGVAAARAFQDEIKLASSPGGPCKIAAFSHPRLGIAGSAARPSVASGARGGVVVWTDDHEQQGHDHAYSVVIDAAGTPRSRPRDLTPEASEVGRPSLLEVGERTLLLYWDRGGHEPGVRVRWLDAEGRIAGASVLVGAARPGAYWPAIDRAPDGFYVTWQDDRDKIGSELYLRHLNSELQPTAPEIRATDYTGGKGKVQPQVRLPSIAVASNAIYDVYKLERDHQNLVLLMRAPLTLPTLATGLDEKPGMNPDGGRADRELGDVEVVNEDHVGGDAPQIACGTEGCFLVWHGDQAGGAYAALVEPVQGRVLWRKKFAPGGAHPAIAVSQEGQVEVAYVEKGLVRVAGLSRDGVGASSSVGHIAGGLTEPARPTIATGGAKGEWYVAWQDGEGGRGEVYTARVTCH